MLRFVGGGALKPSTPLSKTEGRAEMSETGDLEERLAALEAQTGDLADADDLDVAWILWSGILVFCE